MAATRTEWEHLGAPGAFTACVRESAREVYGYVALLTGHDRPAAEDLVASLYAALERELGSGSIDRVTLGRLRTAARRLWVQRHAAEAAAAAPGVADAPRVPTVADLSAAERAVAVFRYVNRMPSGAVADELGLDVRMIDALDARALRRLGADAAASTRLREFWGDTVHPRDEFVDELAPPEPEPELDETLPVDMDTVLAEAAAESAPDDAAPDDAAGDPVDADAPADTADVHHDDVHDAERHDGEQHDAEQHDGERHDAEQHDAGGDGRETSELDAVVVVPPPVEPPAAAADVAALDDTGETSPRRHSRGHTLVVIGTVILAVAAVVGAGALWFSSRDDADGAASTTAPPASTAAPVETTPTSTEAPAPLVGFDPACVEREPPTTAPAAVDEAAFDTFGPLGTSANLAIDLPDSVSTGAITPAVASAVRVAGGIVATVTADPAAPFDGAIVTRVDTDGTVRWVRCFETTVTVRAAGTAAGAAVADALAIGTPDGWSELALDDGTVGDALPAEPAAATSTPFGDPGTTAVWPDPALATIPGEAFTAATTGDVTVVLGCLVAPSATGCDQPVVRGYATADSTLRWERVGVSDVEAVRNGFVVIRYAAPGADPAWYMINASDGTAVDGQVWAAATFSGTASLHGGVLTDSVGGVLTVWYPASAGVGSSSVAVP